MPYEARLRAKYGWGGRIRTSACQDQNLVPYRLATPHEKYLYNTTKIHFQQGYYIQQLQTLQFSSSYLHLKDELCL